MLLLTHFTDAVPRERLLDQFSELAAAPDNRYETQHCERGEISDAIRHYAWSGDDSVEPDPVESSVIFASDLLSDDQRPTELTRSLAREFSQAKVATLAVTRYGHKTLEVDRSIRVDPALDELQEAIGLLRQRLMYIQPAPRRPEPTHLAIRQIHSEAELYHYFKLRHGVYRIMGYLSDELERDCGLEIDDCDRSAIHIGAFVREQPRSRERVAGAVRLLLPHREEFECRKAVEALIESSPALKAAVDRSRLTLELPVFQSNRDLEAHHHAHLSGVRYAELSRMIVDRDMRGRGLAPKLMKAVLDLALAEGVERLLLECLEAHEPLYAHFGFTRIEGVTGRVIGIGRTMVTMLQEVGKSKN